jgi:RNA methyltransferase, TrmH family
VAEAARLHRTRYRSQTGLTLLEGPHLLDEAVAAGARLPTVFSIDPHQMVPSNSELIVVDEAALRRLAGTVTPRGPVAVLEVPMETVVETRHVLVLWGVGDPGNAGTLLRTAAAFGCGVLAGPGSTDVWSPKALRAAAGAQFRTPVEARPELTLAELERRGWTALATAVSGGVDPTTLPDDGYAVLVGDESTGLPGDVLTDAPVRATIPMPGRTESLNAAVAGAIVLYEVSRQK